MIRSGAVHTLYAMPSNPTTFQSLPSKIIKSGGQEAPPGVLANKDPQMDAVKMYHSSRCAQLQTKAVMLDLKGRESRCAGLQTGGVALDLT